MKKQLFLFITTAMLAATQVNANQPTIEEKTGNTFTAQLKTHFTLGEVSRLLENAGCKILSSSKDEVSFEIEGFSYWLTLTDKGDFFFYNIFTNVKHHISLKDVNNINLLLADSSGKLMLRDDLIILSVFLRNEDLREEQVIQSINALKAFNKSAVIEIVKIRLEKEKEEKEKMNKSK